MVCEEELEYCKFQFFRFDNSLIKPCEIVGRLGNEHVRE